MRRHNLLIPSIMTMTLLLIFYSGASAVSQPGEDSALCLGCHESKDMSLTFKNGEKLQLFVDKHGLASSVHKNLSCSNCHGFSMDNHPHKPFKGKRNFSAAASELCRKCHNFKKGVHARMLGALKETLCVDCHGSHAIKPVSDNADACYGCHKYGVSMTYRDGSGASLMMDPDVLKASVHSKLRCTDCHFGFSAREHPQRSFMNKRDFTIVSTEICRRCHFDKYTKTLEGIHFNIMSKGNLNAPVCVDCHGSHRITSGRNEKVRSARRCEQCHKEIYKTYSMSVHGKSLLSENNQDVPVCADCHMAHDITDPRLVDFRNNIPQMCGNCHANKDLMKKYGLSTSVLQSYLEDFHGVTLTFYKKQERPVRHIAVCIDCHGIHDITRVKGPNATVLKANLVKRCQKCHPGAAENFPDSWISHYEPNFKRAPLVYAINLVYSIFIPFMIIGLILQIILHIWRYAVNR
jgi:predicted CXXCH cytochrome family protein